MLTIYEKIDIFIEDENVNKIWDKLCYFSDLDDCVAIEGHTILKGVKYARIPMYVSEERKKELYHYLDKEYSGNAKIF